MQVTLSQLQRIAPQTPDHRLQAFVEPLNDAFVGYQIDTPERIACFLAQAVHESAGFSRLQENLNYSAERLMAVWPKRFPSRQIAVAYANSPEQIANFVYGGRMGNDQYGDGWRYRGRGIFQLTGRDNYTRASKALGQDFVATPDLLVDPEWATETAGWFWQTNHCNELADSKNIAAISKAVNGGTLGLKERTHLTSLALEVLA